MPDWWKLLKAFGMSVGILAAVVALFTLVVLLTMLPAKVLAGVIGALFVTVFLFTLTSLIYDSL